MWETDEKKQEFLDEIPNHGSFSAAARAVGIRRETAWVWRRDDPAYATACEQARAEAYEMLQDSMYKRAIKSDTLAGIFLMKGEWPEKYRDNSTLKVEGTVLVGHLNLDQLPVADQAQIFELARQKVLSSPAGDDDA